MMPPYFPLREWRLKNFKSVIDETVPLAPLTILVGSNSSGKSSLIQSILLLAQAAQGPATRDTLSLNGPLVSLGGFDDVVSAYSPEKAISIGGTYVSSPQRDRALEYARRRYPWAYRYSHVAPTVLAAEGSTLSFDIALKGKAKNQPGHTNVHRVSLAGSASFEESIEEIRFTSNRVDPNPQTQQMYAAGRRADWRLYPMADLSLSFRGRLKIHGQNIRTYGLGLRAGLPRAVSIEADQNAVLVRGWINFVRRALRARPTGRTRRTQDTAAALDQFVQFAVSQLRLVLKQLNQKEPINVFSESVVGELLGSLESTDLEAAAHVMLRTPSDELGARIYKELGPGPRVLVQEDEYNEWLGEFHHTLTSLLAEQLYYLGPLRQDPQVIYKTAPSPISSSLGTKGEYTAQTLHALRDVSVVCPVNLDGQVEQRSLNDAVSHWLDHHGVATSVHMVDKGRLGLEMRVQEKAVPRPFDLTNVGVGVSQLLPVIVSCLVAPPGSLILLEQPELHLNPAIQQSLGDFLLACARSGRQLIVETHSEHVVARLRRRIAEDPTDGLLDYVRFIYAERNQGRTEYREVHPTRYGSLEEWPVGFFDQTAKESEDILRAAVTKRKLESPSASRE